MRVVPEVMGGKEEQLESAVVRGAGRWEHCGCHVSVMSWKNAICGSALVDVSRARLLLEDRGKHTTAITVRGDWGMGKNCAYFQSS